MQLERLVSLRQISSNYQTPSAYTFLGTHEAGVAAGRNPPVWLKAGDVVEVSITGLGTLTNTVESSTHPATECEPVRTRSIANMTSDPDTVLLPSGKRLFVEISTPKSHPNQSKGKIPTVLVIHGLGGSTSNGYALIEASKIGGSHRVISFDLEGSGKSPLFASTSIGLGKLCIEAFAEDARFLLEALKIDGPVSIIAHSMGGVRSVPFLGELLNTNVAVMPL